MTAAASGRFFHLEGSEIERCYKYHLSDYKTWDQKGHAVDWVLIPKNIGERCSIDETRLCEEVYTILSNKAGHGGKGSVIAVVKGTKAEVVPGIIKQIPTEELAKVREVTMDFSDSIYSIAKQCFPNATIVIDCFRIVKRLCEGLESIRLKFRRIALTENKKAAAAFAKEEERKARQRAYYRKNHRKNPTERRGGKRIKKQKYKPRELSNGDTETELLPRSRNLLSQSADKWGKQKKERTGLLFGLYPQIKEGYSLICKVRSIFRMRLTVEEARVKLHEWYKEVNACTLREIKSARDCIKSQEEEVLNHFINRSTNASAESLNSNIKGFRAQLRGIADMPFFLYRLCTILG